jgi:hypothetical protein
LKAKLDDFVENAAFASPSGTPEIVARRAKTLTAARGLNFPQQFMSED